MCDHDLSPGDPSWMDLALAEAGKGRGAVEPNPMVGALIVREGKVVGWGYHARFGGPHAEIMALREAKSAARGATLYVTLEPCCHHGKTPPCTDAILCTGWLAWWSPFVTHFRVWTEAVWRSCGRPESRSSWASLPRLRPGSMRRS